MIRLFVARVLRYNLLYCKKVLIDCIEFRLQIKDCVEVALELGRGICYVMMTTVTAPPVRVLTECTYDSSPIIGLHAVATTAHEAR